MVILGTGICLLAYLLGSIPSGVLFVRLVTGRDIREVGSGRTGGTNAMRAGGSFVGLATGLLDVAKSALAVGIAHWILPDAYVVAALAGIFAVIGHNYSFYLVDWPGVFAGKMPVFHGGAGGAPALGAAIAFWPPIVLIVLPVGLIIFFGIGYASLTTLMCGILIVGIFAVRALLGFSSIWYAICGLVILGLMIWALRPNLERLRAGTERLVGIRAWLAERNTKNRPPAAPAQETKKTGKPPANSSKSPNYRSAAENP